MLSHDLYVAEQTMGNRLEERRRAHARRQHREASARQPGWLSWQARWLVCELGYRLVALGARLEAYALPPYRPRA
jgi:hypothetical protein